MIILMVKVSVVIPTYNGGKYVRECVSSILSQTFGNLEIVIVDDQSTDDTVKVVRDIQTHDDRITLYINSCHNHSMALNLGLQHADGDYIARIDQDDIMVTTRLMEQVNYMEQHKDVDVCCSWFSTFGDINQNVELAKGDIDYPEYQLLITNIFPNPTAMIRKKFLEQNNIKYDCQYQYAEDYAFWIECALSGAKFHIIPRFLQRYRIHNTQNSIVHSKEQYYETVKMRTCLINVLQERHKSWADVTRLIEILWDISRRGKICTETVFRIANELYINSLKQSVKI